MGQRAAALADQLENALANFAAAIEGCSDEQWTSGRTTEGWSVAATAQHVAGQFPLELEYITAAAESKTMPGYSWDDINGKNDGRASANMSAKKSDVIAQLKKEGGAAASYVRGLSDEQLDRTAPLKLADGAMVSTQQLIEGGVLIAHVTGHLESM
ncbi:MAG TPA: DinB family protein, partial [Dehalococcoidia bacterium]